LQHIPQVGELTVFCGALWVRRSISLVNAHLRKFSWRCRLRWPWRHDRDDPVVSSRILLFFVARFRDRSLIGDSASSSFRLTGKRIFRMSPLHHHFELAG